MNHHWHTPSSNININVHQSSWDFMSTFNSFQFHFSHHSPHVSPQDAMQRVGSQTAATNGLGPKIARVTLRDCHGNKKRRRIRTRSTHVCWGGWASGQPIFFDLNSTKLDHAASGAPMRNRWPDWCDSMRFLSCPLSLLIIQNSEGDISKAEVESRVRTIPKDTPHATRLCISRCSKPVEFPANFILSLPHWQHNSSWFWATGWYASTTWAWWRPWDWRHIIPTQGWKMEDERSRPSVSWMISLIDCSIDWLVDWSIHLSIHLSIYLSIYYDLSINHSINLSFLFIAAYIHRYPVHRYSPTDQLMAVAFMVFWSKAGWLNCTPRSKSKFMWRLHQMGWQNWYQIYLNNIFRQILRCQNTMGWPTACFVSEKTIRIQGDGLICGSNLGAPKNGNGSAKKKTLLCHHWMFNHPKIGIDWFEYIWIIANGDGSSVAAIEKYSNPQKIEMLETWTY